MLNECKIVEDLLPLYAEELVSPESAEFIREHCGRCEHCQILLRRCEEVEPMNTMNVPNYQKALKKERRHSAMIGALFATIMIVLALAWAVWGIGYAPVKLDKEPIILTSPDGIHSFQGEYYTSRMGNNRGLFVTEKWRGGWHMGTSEGWIDILDAQWSPDGTDLFFTIEMENGETEMQISYNNYNEDGSSHGVFPHISKNREKRAYNDLTAEFTSLLAQWVEFPTGWETIAYEFVEWGEDSESAYIHYETDNGCEGTVYFGFDFENGAIWIIE